MKTITTQEAESLLCEIGHIANVTVPIKDKLTGSIDYKTVLNDGMVYNPFYLKQLGMSNNANNAKRAMKQILKVGRHFKIYSSYFSWATNEYYIED